MSQIPKVREKQNIIGFIVKNFLQSNDAKMSDKHSYQDKLEYMDHPFQFNK